MPCEQTLESSLQDSSRKGQSHTTGELLREILDRYGFLRNAYSNSS